MRRADRRRKTRRAAHAARTPASEPKTGPDAGAVVLDEAFEERVPTAEEIVAGIRSDDDASFDFREGLRAPPPVRALEAVVEREGVPTVPAREIAARVVREHADDPDTRETWTAIYYDGVAAARSWLAFGQGPTSKESR